ncbi:hypothetical protein GCM10009133_35750 [Cocleimonas flava]|uniref:Limiting CO2-inducible protein B/C beta carbonyic anhydrase domain-containing protein n=1 Tax=Cocleimonas flava TaxID=634765 RepID=A0A4R1F7E7_9GAMM|nr:hypothetical protein [Cocleimonas flava]TCJ88582.1 hypothetical protein EV695_0440 [Cocleimonas flava]
MYGEINTSKSLLASFKMSEVAMRYNQFVSRAYNLSKSLGFTPGKIMPSRAFCSDESQGYPIILIAKNFGVFPFDHGQVGAVISTDRHGPHAHHGKDLVIIHASHVGYDPESGTFGVYRRLQTDNHEESTSCGKVCASLDWYSKEFEFASTNILLSKEGDENLITIDNRLLNSEREQGLMLKLDTLIEKSESGQINAIKSLSTSKVFPASAQLIESIGNDFCPNNKPMEIGKYLSPDSFSFRRQSNDHLENNLINAMPYIVTSKWPALKAAQVNTQVEFDNAFRSVVQEPEYQGKRLLFISGLNVDISPQKGQLFPLTKFIPWAAYHQTTDGKHETWEQAELYDRLKSQSTENPDEVDLEEAIKIMGSVEEIKLPF